LSCIGAAKLPALCILSYAPISSQVIGHELSFGSLPGHSLESCDPSITTVDNLPRSLFFRRTQVVGYTFFSQIRKYDVLTPLYQMWALCIHRLSIRRCCALPRRSACLALRASSSGDLASQDLRFEKDREVVCSTRCTAYSDKL
jgi:hypothetical protein